MKKIIYLYQSKYDKETRKLELFCTQHDFLTKYAKENDVAERYPLDFEAILDRIPKINPTPTSVRLICFGRVEEVKRLLEPLRESILSLELFKCADLDDLSFIEDLPNLQTLVVYWNRKATKLFDAKKLKNLSEVYIRDAKKINDYSGLSGSNVSVLTLEAYSEFTPDLPMENLNFLRDMPKLKKLVLGIRRTDKTEEFINDISCCKNLVKLRLSQNITSGVSHYFTFEQFAYLAAHLPAVKDGLEPYEEYENKYYLLGRGKTRVGKEKAKLYAQAFERLKQQFKDKTVPPPDDYSIDIE